MTTSDLPSHEQTPTPEAADGRGPVARWLATTYTETTPGQRWTICLALILAVALIGFGLRKGSVIPSLALGSPTQRTPTAAAPAAATALGPLSTVATASGQSGSVTGASAPTPATVAPDTPPASESPVASPGPVPSTGPTVTFEAAQQHGWWWQANPGSQQGLPTASPSPADVPAQGLLVEGGPGSGQGSADTCSPLAAAPATACDAYGGLVFAVPDGTTVTALTLTVYDPSGTGMAPDTTPGSTLELCPLVSGALNSEQGGPMSDGPSFSCTSNVTAAPGADGHTYTFKVGALPLKDGVLAVAVLPTAATDRVVLNPSDSHSLQFTSAAASSRSAVLRYLLGLIW